MTLLCSCSGGGGTAGSLPAMSIGNVTVPLSIELGLTPTTAALPTVAGIAGSIVFPAVETATTVGLSASTAPPAGVASRSVRHTRSDFALEIYEYITLAPKTTVRLPFLPALNFTFPAELAVTGKSVFFGITDPLAQPGALAAFETEGPAKVSGQHATIGALARPLVLLGGRRYTFIVYAMSVASSIASPTIYIANSGSGSVTTYHPDGTPDLAPITSGLLAPQAVALSHSGTLYVLDPVESVVTSYASNGVRKPLTITLPKSSGPDEAIFFFGIDVGPDGTIDLPTIDCLDSCGYGGIARYAPDGTSLAPIDMTPSMGVLAEAVDAAGNIDVIGAGGATVTRYAHDGSTHVQVVSGLRNAIAIAVDVAGHLFVVADNRISSYNADGSPRRLAISLDFVPGTVAVDESEKIYVSDPADDLIFSYNADGSPAAPTIATGRAPAGIAVH